MKKKPGNIDKDSLFKTIPVVFSTVRVMKKSGVFVKSDPILAPNSFRYVSTCG